MPASLRYENLSVSYGPVTALSGVTTAFEPGFNVVLGPNGAGKSTLFRAGAGVLPPDSGRVSIDGTDPFEQPGVKRSVGYLAHGTPLNSQLTVRENLDYWGRVQGFDAATRDRHVERVAETMGLDDLLERPGTDLSRGQKQRVMIARCLLPDPSVLFLDEPTTGLDPTAADALRERLAELADEGRVLCYATHNLYEAERLADTITVVRDGRVVAEGAKAELTGRLRGSAETSVRVTCDADAEDFEALDVAATASGEEWTVTLPADRRVADLVRALVERGVAIHAVQPAGSSLDALYRELAGGEGDV